MMQKGNLTKITEPGNLVTTAVYNSKVNISNTDPKEMFMLIVMTLLVIQLL